MTDATLSYAQALRRHAAACAKIRAPLVFSLDPISAAHLADIIERGCHRSRYVREVQAEAERLRDEAEAQLLRARDLNEAADRALGRADPHRRRMAVAAAGFFGGLLAVAIWAVLA